MLNGVHLAMITTKRILAERLLPAAIESAMTVREFGSRIEPGRTRGREVAAGGGHGTNTSITAGVISEL